MKVFIAGARAVTALDGSVQKRLYNIYNKGYAVLVGDADGVDSAVQEYFSNLNYRDVTVYASEGKARNNSGKWDVREVAVPLRSRGFSYYAAKDKAMADDADYGFMIWNGESKGTLNNIINLLKQDKKSIVYLTSNGSFHSIDNFDELQDFAESCGQTAQSLLSKLSKDFALKAFEQVSLF